MLTMRKSSEVLAFAALVACAALAKCPPASAADLRDLRATANTRGALVTASSQSHTHDLDIALRAQWLAHGHSVQQLASLAPPTVTGGSVTASTITVGVAGEYPALSVAYTTDTPGLNYVAAEFVSPSGETAYGGQYVTAYYTQGGTLSFAITTPLSLYAQPGKWTLSALKLGDNAGNTTTYNATQLASLFKNLSFTVVNTGPSIKAPPKITAGSLLNTTVSLSARFPALQATITASDKGGPGIYEAYLLIQPPGVPYNEYAVLPNPEPIKAGKIKANSVFNAFSPTGTWKIIGYAVCDYAYNCEGSTTDADVVQLLGTDTFTVTP